MRLSTRLSGVAAAVALLASTACTSATSPTATAATVPPHASSAVPVQPRPQTPASEQPTTAADRYGPSDLRTLQLATSIGGAISPKSVVASGTGLFFAQNMMYRHTITVYDRQHQLVRTIPDRVDLARFGVGSGTVRGAPVEAAFSPDGRYAYVSNYSMYGAGYPRAGHDFCKPANHYDESFVYRVDTSTLTIDAVIPVGSVPKYVAVSPDNRLLLVSNWCSYDVSVVDTTTLREVTRVPVGAYPRGIVVDPSSRRAYIAVMGSWQLAVIDLTTMEVTRHITVGNSPRHLALSPDGRTLYVTLNGAGQVAKVGVATGTVTARVRTGKAPRTMVLAADGRSLYVVNYYSNTVSKLRTSDMAVLQTVPTKRSPIGITQDTATGEIWVACYTGTIMVFTDR